MKKVEPYYKSTDRSFTLLKGDCKDVLQDFEFKFDMIFADPPYFLSNGGITLHNGQKACVNKGEWDKSYGMGFMNAFNESWLKQCKEKLKPEGTIWFSSSYHNIFSIGETLNRLNFKILNIITWVKVSPPNNISCHCFTHSAEYIIWARYCKETIHYYNYNYMKILNNDKQMTDVWHLPAVARWEKSCGKHPTQKPLGLLARLIIASTHPGDWILDPFNGSGTTGIAANLLKRKFLGIDTCKEYLELSKSRRMEIDKIEIANQYYKNLHIEL